MAHWLRDLVGRLLCTDIDEVHELPPSQPKPTPPSQPSVNHVAKQHHAETRRAPHTTDGTAEEADSIMAPKRKSESTVAADGPEIAKPTKKSKKEDERGNYNLHFLYCNLSWAKRS